MRVIKKILGCLTCAMLLMFSGDVVRLSVEMDGMPRPLEKISEESEKQRLRHEWIEQMHKTAPGVDWREMDEEAREELYQQRLPELQKNAEKRTLKSGGMETIADGTLTGTWIEKGSGNQAGRVHCVDIDFASDKIYAASDGGQVWMGNTDGTEWLSLSDPYRIDNIQFIRAFQNNKGGSRILAANHRVRMNYTDDDGITWLKSAGMDTYYRDYELIRAVSQNDGTLYMLAFKSGYLYLFRSTNLGDSFVRMIRTAGSRNSDIWTNRFGKDTVYLVDRNQVFKLADSTRFEKTADIPLNFTTDQIQQVQFAGCQTDSAAYLYVMYRIDKKTRFFGMDDDGKTWRYRGENEEGPFMPNSFGVSQTNPRLLGFGGVNAYRSENGGPTWLMVNGWGEYYGDVRRKLHADIPEVEFFRTPQNREFIFISTDGGTFYSSDGMKSVTNVSLKGLNISQYYTTYTHRTQNNVIYAGSQDQGFQKSYSGGEGVVDFDQTISGDYGHIVSGDQGKSIWTVYPGFAMYYPDAANSNGISTWDFKGKNHFWMPPLMADPYFPNKVWLAGGTSDTGNHIWLLEYSNGSISYSEQAYDFSGGDQNAWISAMAFSPINRDYRYVLNSYGQFYYSSDGGVSWERAAGRGPGSHYFYGNSIVPSPKDINTIYLAGSGYSGSSVWVTHDGGQTFAPMSSGLANTLIFQMVSNEDGSLLFAASEIAPWVYIRSQDKWYDLSGLHAPQQTWWSVDYIPSMKTARFGTYGRGIWDFKIGSFTGMEELAEKPVEQVLSIWPNPCSNSLNINIPTGESGRCKIDFYSADGRLMKSCDFTGENLAGQTVTVNVDELPAGIYIVKLRISGGVGRVVKR